MTIFGFGRKKREAWEQFARRMGAQFVKGGLSGSHKVVARARQWTIIIDSRTETGQTYSTSCTRMIAPYVNKDGFRFRIRRRAFFNGVAKALGMQEIEVGHSEFDRHFIVKGNDESKARALLANARVRRLIQAIAQESGIWLEVKDHGGWFVPSLAEGVDELWLLVQPEIEEAEPLQSAYQLVAETLNQLCEMGSASEEEAILEL